MATEFGESSDCFALKRPPGAQVPRISCAICSKVCNVILHTSRRPAAPPRNILKQCHETDARCKSHPVGRTHEREQGRRRARTQFCVCTKFLQRGVYNILYDSMCSILRGRRAAVRGADALAGRLQSRNLFYSAAELALCYSYLRWQRSKIAFVPVSCSINWELKIEEREGLKGKDCRLNLGAPVMGKFWWFLCCIHT